METETRRGKECAPKKDLVVFCGNNRDFLLNLLREKTDEFLLNHVGPNILAMFTDDTEVAHWLDVSRIPVFAKGNSVCRENIMPTISRLDPDMILIDEVRTAGEALAVVRLAETGESVFTTLYSDSEEDALSTWSHLTQDVHSSSKSFLKNNVSIQWMTEKHDLQ